MKGQTLLETLAVTPLPYRKPPRGEEASPLGGKRGGHALPSEGGRTTVNQPLIQGKSCLDGMREERTVGSRQVEHERGCGFHAEENRICTTRGGETPSIRTVFSSQGEQMHKTLSERRGRRSNPMKEMPKDIWVTKKWRGAAAMIFASKTRQSLPLGKTGLRRETLKEGGYFSEKGK